MGENVRFDPDVLREIMWQGMTNEEYRNFLNLDGEFDEALLIEEDFDVEERINAQELEEDFYDDQYLIDEDFDVEERINAQELEEDFDEAQELIEKDFHGEGRSCLRLLWAALASKFCKQRRRWRRRIIKHPR